MLEPLLVADWNSNDCCPICHYVLVKPLVTFNNMNVDYTAEIKFLGIRITGTLKWHSHVQLLAGKLCKVAFMIKSLKEVLSPNLIRNIYFTKFHSLLRFGYY